MNRFRTDVIDVLQQIASKSNQIDLHKAAETPFNIPTELLKNWKQAYQPESSGFNETFTPAELNQLSRFTKEKRGQVLRFAFLEFDKARLDRLMKFTEAHHPNRLDAVDAILNT